MQPCSLFDKYRDEELEPDELEHFTQHLTSCPNCRGKLSLLDNLVYVLRQDETPVFVDLAERIAEKAFQQARSWDAMVVSWLKPGPVWAALALVIVAVSFLWLGSSYNPTNASYEYETLMEEAEAMNLDVNVLEIQDNSELVIWLAQESGF